MAVYFSYLVSTPPGQLFHPEWHRIHPLLAVPLLCDRLGSKVCVYNGEGLPVNQFILNNTSAVSVLEWHPTKKVFACGLECGDIIVCDLANSVPSVASLIHTDVISVMLWTFSGTHLITGDRSGMLVRWEMSKGVKDDVPFRCYHLHQELTHAISCQNWLNNSLLQKPSATGRVSSGSPSPADDTRLTPINLLDQDVDTFWFSTRDDENGNVFCMTDTKEIVHRFKTDGPVKKLLICEEKLCLITLTTKMIVTMHNILSIGDVVEIMKVKLSVLVESQESDLASLGFGLLGCCTGDNIIRVWDLYSHDNYILTLKSQAEQNLQEQIVCLNYSKAKGILACGTVSGMVAVWKYVPSATDKALELDKCWKLQASVSFGEAVTALIWGSAFLLLAVRTSEHIYIMHEHTMSAHCSDGTTVVQTGSTQIAVEVFPLKFQSSFTSEVQIKGVFTTKDDFVVWDRQRVIVYSISMEPALRILKAGDFSASASKVCVYDKNVYTLEVGKVKVRNFQGVIKQSLPFFEVEGGAVHMDVCSKFLLVVTANNFVKIYDLSRSRDAKMFVVPKNLAEILVEIDRVVSVKCNVDATKVSMILTTRNMHWNSRIYIWDTESDGITTFNFATGKVEREDHRGDGRTSLKKSSDNENSRNCPATSSVVDRYPHCQFWDSDDPRLLCVETKLLHFSSPGCQDIRTDRSDVEEEEVIVSLFVSSDCSIHVQNSFNVEQNLGRLLALEIPFFYFTEKHFECSSSDFSSVVETKEIEDPALSGATQNLHFSAVPISLSSGSAQSFIIRRVHPDFAGFEDADKITREALMNFYYNLNIGDLDEAFRVLRVIKSESVWATMAAMCVKSGRLDVARVCLGRMNNPRMAMALRQAMKEPESEARTALLAFHLQLPKEGIQLLNNCGRYDLLNRYYQAVGKWDEALQIARSKDRINLHNTHFKHARYLESEANIPLAVFNYECSLTYRAEVPRLLYAEHEDIEEYVKKTNDLELYKWWGRFSKWRGNFERAAEAFEKASDVFSLVQLYCDTNQLQLAMDLCRETHNRAACCYLAHYLMRLNRIQDAFHYFCQAQIYGPIIRICRKNQRDEHLMEFALLGNSDDMIEVAEYFRKISGHEDKAILLYNKAGCVSQAVQLAFQLKQFIALQAISESLVNLTDPELLLRTAQFFIENFQYDLAVDLLAVAERHREAIKICTEQHVPMTDVRVEKLVPSKDIEDAERIRILETLGELCFSQGEYHLATKKFIEAGNKVKAMKVLLKSGDTDKIVFFAGVARQKEIYVMAANYLQSIDWHDDSYIVKHIVSFYKRGGAADSLCNFHIACAQLEIDNFKNYEKALTQLAAGYDALAAKNPTETSGKNASSKIAELMNRMVMIKQFLDAQKLYSESKTREAMLLVLRLLKQPNIQHSVRTGDLLAFCIDHYAKLSLWKPAHHYLSLLEKHVPKTRLTFYVDEKIMLSVKNAVNIPQSESETAVTEDTTSATNEPHKHAVQMGEQSTINPSL